MPLASTTADTPTLSAARLRLSKSAPQLAPAPETDRGWHAWLTPFRVVGGTWLLMSLALVAFAYSYRAATPFSDEWELVQYLVGAEPLSLANLWKQHNEHRIPLVKLLLVTVVQGAGGDFRAASICVAVCLVASCAWLLVGVRRWRGTWHYTDAVFPLVMLHWSHWELFQNTFALQMVLATAGVLALSVLVLQHRDGWNPATLATAVPWLCLLTLAGSMGAPFLCALGVWLLFCGMPTWWHQRRTGLIQGSLQVGLGILSFVLVGCYFWGLTRAVGLPQDDHLWQVIVFAVQLASTAVVPSIDFVAPVFGSLFIGLLGLSGLRLLQVAYHDPAERCRASGLLLLVGAGAGLVLAVASSRAGLGVGTAYASRYLVMMIPLLVLVYLTWDQYGAGTLGAKIPLGLCLLAFLVLGIRTYKGERNFRNYHALNQAFAQSVMQGRPADEIAARFGGRIYPDTARLAAFMMQLRAADVGVFANLPADPAATKN